jgi:integrase
MAVRCFYRWYNRQGGGEDPTAGITIRKPKREPRRPFTDSELRRLLGHTETEQEMAFLLMFIHSGARKSEVIQMQCEDIDWVRGEVLIRHGKGDKERRVAPGRATMQALAQSLRNRKKGPVWLSQVRSPMRRATADLYLKRIAERAGVVDVTFHRFRATLANRFLKDGTLDELQNLLGHSNIATTAHYASWTVKDRALGRQRSLADRFKLPLKMPGFIKPFDEGQKTRLRIAEAQMREAMRGERTRDTTRGGSDDSGGVGRRKLAYGD